MVWFQRIPHTQVVLGWSGFRGSPYTGGLRVVWFQRIPHTQVVLGLVWLQRVPIPSLGPHTQVVLKGSLETAGGYTSGLDNGGGGGLHTQVVLQTLGLHRFVEDTGGLALRTHPIRYLYIHL